MARIIGTLIHETLIGSHYDDFIFGDTEHKLDRLGFSDRIYAGSGNDTVYGDAYVLFGHGTGGKDVIYGESGLDRLYGDAYAMHDYSVGGDDYLDGGSTTSLSSKACLAMPTR